MTTIPREAIEAAAAFLPGIPTDNRERQLRETTMRAALTAALPHIEAAIRAQVAAAIETELGTTIFHPHYRYGMERAAAIARGADR